MADDVSNKLLGGLNRIGLAMRSAAWDDAVESGLTPTQSQILAFISGRAGQNPRSGDAADALGITPQTASVAIAALVNKGLVAKVPDSSDRRASDGPTASLAGVRSIRVESVLRDVPQR